ncbi:MAG: tetraacyldisaccharide 4'-kinase [Pseudomonadota bacterium]
MTRAVKLYEWIQRVWYEDGRGGWLLVPVSLLFWLVSSVRRALFRNRWLSVTDVGVPVIVVGNITAGGTGKTPVTIWLARQLQARGQRVAIISRGYGGATRASYLRVSGDSDPAEVGDEPVLMARRSGCPVIVGSDRVAAAREAAMLEIDVLLADDGLQHYRLYRSYEICVIDGARQLGNRRLIPAGPLRETPRRLLSVDQVLINGQCENSRANAAQLTALCFSLQPGDAVRLSDESRRSLSSFAGQRVTAVAGIGNPSRFFDMLRKYDIEVVEHPVADHAMANLRGIDPALPVLMTEKDAVKRGKLPNENCWSVPVELSLDDQLAAAWLEQLDSRLAEEKRRYG